MYDNQQERKWGNCKQTKIEYLNKRKRIIESSIQGFE